MGPLEGNRSFEAADSEDLHSRPASQEPYTGPRSRAAVPPLLRPRNYDAAAPLPPAHCPLFATGARRPLRPAHSSPEVGMTGRHRLRDSGLQVFATCPPSYTAAPEQYLRDVVTVARWSDAAQCEGMLIYTDNGLVDPWSVAQAVIAHTERLAPLVAVQPIYMHPYAIAKLVATLGFLYGRRVYLNMVAGGFKNDLEALGDPTPHDERYARLVEYT